MFVSKLRRRWTTLAIVLVPVTFAAAQDRGSERQERPLDQLRPENIPEYERRVAAVRNGGTLPEGLVAILGDSRWQHGAVCKVVVLPDGKSCVTAGGTTLIVWDLQTGEALRVMPRASTQELVTAALSGDGHILAGGGRGGDVTLWNLPEGHLRHRVKTVGGAVGLPRDGSRLVTADSSLAEISVWDTESNQLVREIEPIPAAYAELQQLSIGVSRVCVSPDGALIAAAHWIANRGDPALPQNATRIVLWDAQSDRPPRVLEGHATRDIRVMVFSLDGRRLASCGIDGHVKLWNVADGRLVWDYQTTMRRWVHDLAFSPGGEFIWALVNEELFPIDVKNGRAGTPVRVPADTTCFSILPDGAHAVIAGHGPRVINLRTARLERPSAPEARGGRLTAVAFRTDDGQLAAASENGLILLWELPSCRLERRLMDHDSCVNAVAYSPDGSLLATADCLGNHYFWESATGRRIESRTGPLFPRQLAFDSSGTLLSSFNALGQIDVWNLSTWQRVQTIHVDKKSLGAIAFLPDGSGLLTTPGTVELDSGHVIRPRSVDRFIPPDPFWGLSSDGTRILQGNRIIDFESESEIAVLEVPNALTSATFEPSGRRVGGISDVDQILVCDAANGRLLWSQSGIDREGRNNSFTFSHDGRYLAYPAGNGTVHIIRIPLPPPQPE